MYEMRVCSHCHKTKYMDVSFKYCSWECRNAANAVTKICEFCGKRFTTQARKQKCCSRKCGQLNIRKGAKCQMN